ncbi:MAG TPA: hypothetical protein VKB17_01355 [Thermoleophilaceae bacterium]|nr:hypothetical protein [Thermoleophilaceae bacterium]
MVDAQLEPLRVHALVRGASFPVHPIRVAGVGVAEHELHYVVQQRGAEQLAASEVPSR